MAEINQVENISQIIIFIILLYSAWNSSHMFRMSEKTLANKQNKFFPKLPYMTNKLLGLFGLVFFISIMEKMLFYPNVDTTLSLKFSSLVVLIYLIGIFVKEKIKK